MHKRALGESVSRTLSPGRPAVLGGLGDLLRATLLEIMSASWHRDALSDPVPPHLRKDVGI